MGVLFLHLLLPLQFVLPTKQLSDLQIALPGHFLFTNGTTTITGIADHCGGVVIVIIIDICTITITSTVGAIIVVVVVFVTTVCSVPTSTSLPTCGGFAVATGGVVVVIVILLTIFVLIFVLMFLLLLLVIGFRFLLIFATGLLLLGLSFALVFAETFQKDLRVTRLNERNKKESSFGWKIIQVPTGTGKYKYTSAYMQGDVDVANAQNYVRHK